MHKLFAKNVIIIYKMPIKEFINFSKWQTIDFTIDYLWAVPL